ncbi:hypothetical protein CI238_05502 [Colletotrichum incanum]|uniref:Uncharacterized protein n=1 Tax=Colletotrichum incanum TaxID=1573173 RepID=A0A161WMZ4_COLIC|nr:hypothetical protein CI238_05502 [Colletotrichum incanum]
MVEQTSLPGYHRMEMWRNVVETDTRVGNGEQLFRTITTSMHNSEVDAVQLAPNERTSLAPMARPQPTRGLAYTTGIPKHQAPGLADRRGLNSYAVSRQRLSPRYSAFLDLGR